MPNCLRSRSRAKWWGSASHSPWPADFTAFLLYSEDVARLISELLDATTDADPAWREQVLGLIRLALDLKRGQHEAPSQEAIAAAWQGDSNSGLPPGGLPGGRGIGGLSCGSLALWRPLVTVAVPCLLSLRVPTSTGGLLVP
jgi:hypothetical protein